MVLLLTTLQRYLYISREILYIYIYMISKNNVTALHVAAKWGRVDMVKVLLDFNANVELCTRDGIRPLHCAASQGHLEVCSLLVNQRADCNAKTKV